MKIDKVDISGLGKLIEKELEEYSAKVYVAAVETCNEGIKESRRYINQEMVSIMKGKTEDRKHYRSSFSTHKKGDLSRVLWNKQYQLSHLLEDGHYVYNQYGGNYDIHPEWPLIWGFRHDGMPYVYGSEYGTSGKKTIALGSWGNTEKHTADYVEKTLLKKLK